ncbi:hypothetical protein [Acinetobacter sp. MD2(2019)]|uniref:hypothetical protein n=1 Tax=Acinetobacter sp. MD2(2019) TaxID=2605273 RepID=UPI002D1E50FD|nr:hypothetical protein [Acinetobacter sp. MD2(2019)]MEB3755214.1 hypothetical protein [Acinetobacter sp. MD2(2019)]
MQQILALYFNDLGVAFNQITSMFISIFFAYITWNLIEKPFIDIGKRLIIKNTNQSKFYVKDLKKSLNL